ncbi:MAG TPA: 23S ribosomal RNA methyltransferase Erm [Ktedonobacterales bacterium]|jgi:23S rRNA (adenine-N6)-dimethyltransferase|nr:23S ribosomal RNA methyltransferase Erm [Ktedonobacterales bacterium]
MSHTPIRYSQNFLRDPRLVERLLEASSVGPADLVVEIGPGAGIITDELARRAGRVVAVELDATLAARLRRRYADTPQVAIHTGDFLEHALPEQPYKVFASIPFACTHEIVTRLTSAACSPQDAYLIMQREAAEKFCGVPREYLYSALLKPWFALEITHHFRRSDFTPAPSVEVVMLRIQKRGPPLLAAHERQQYRDFVVHSFTAHQPDIEQTLRAILSHRQSRQILRLCEITPDATPSSISFPQWLQLYRHVVRLGDEQLWRTIGGSEARLRSQQRRLRKQHRTRAPSPQPSPRGRGSRRVDACHVRVR